MPNWWDQFLGAGAAPQTLSDLAAQAKAQQTANAPPQAFGDVLDPTGQSSSSMAEDAWRWLKTGGYPHGGAAATPDQAAQFLGAYGGVAPPTMQAPPPPVGLPEAGAPTGSLPSQPGPQPRTSGATMAPIPMPAGHPATNDQLNSWLGSSGGVAPPSPGAVAPAGQPATPEQLQAVLSAGASGGWPRPAAQSPGDILRALLQGGGGAGYGT